MGDGAGLRLLLPQLLQQISHAAESNKSTRRTVGMGQRRTFLLGLCAAFPLPSTQTWPLPLLRQVVQTLDDLSRARGGTQKRDQYEPVPSSFHLEVTAVLKLVAVEHAVETPQPPFNLDITITPAQVKGISSQVL